MNEHGDKQLTQDQLDHIREHFGVTKVVTQLLGHIAYLDAELTRTGQYYEEFLIPKMEQDGREDNDYWRKRLENARAEAKRPNPLGLPPGR
ncbi:MAG: hypothetical protein U0794_00545 [Isosphaeraceae bacterium]